MKTCDLSRYFDWPAAFAVNHTVCTVADPEGSKVPWPPPNLWQFFHVPSIAFDPPTMKTLPYNQTRSVSDHPLRRYVHLRILGHVEPAFWGKGRS